MAAGLLRSKLWSLPDRIRSLGGTAAGVGEVLGVLCGGLIGTRLIPRDVRWELWLPAIAYGGSAPLYALVFLSPSPWIAIQPTICAVQGIATGAGGCITSACDFRIGADNARIGYGEVKFGINLMWNAVPICVHLVGPARAKQMIMTGKLFDATTLERWGFLDQVVPLNQLEAAAGAMAEAYAALPPISVQMIKRSINNVAGALDRAVKHMDADQWLLSSLSEDYKEAVGAFFDKRQPTFKGN